MNSKHALFQKFPLNGTTKLSTGDAPTPYHVYDGYGLFVGGSVEYAVASELLRHEELVPSSLSKTPFLPILRATDGWL